jgi:hypothetical protein
MLNRCILVLCPNCLQKNAVYSNFCYRCGRSLIRGGYPYALYTPLDLAYQVITLLSRIWYQLSPEERRVILEWTPLAIKGSYEAAVRLRQWLNDHSRFDERLFQ